MMVSIGDFMFRHRNAIFPVLCLLLLMPGPPIVEDPLLAALIGALIAAVGQGTRIATIGLRYIVRGGRDRRVYAEDLVTEGLYAACRNPMYVGNLLIVAGLGFASNAAVSFVTLVALALFAYVAIVAAEERFLHKKFGASYDAYCRDVPRWLPRPGALRTGVAGHEFHWRRVVVKEYGTPFGWVSVMCLIVLYNLWRADALRDDEAAVRLLLASMILVAALWATARVLKKTRRLVAD